MVGLVKQSKSRVRFRESDVDIEAIGTGGRVQFPKPIWYKQYTDEISNVK